MPDSSRHSALPGDGLPAGAEIDASAATGPETPRPDTECKHCALPVGPNPIGDGPYFCCTGCEIVFHALRDNGWDDTFYRLTDVARERDATPASPSIDPLVLSELDSDAFIEDNTVLNDDGSRTVELFLDGVHCAACVWLVERLPQERDGVLSARLDLPRARLTLAYAPGAIELSDVATWLAQFGYTAHPVRHDSATARTEGERRLLVKVGVCWALAGNVMLLAFALYAGLDASQDPGLATAARWLSMILATVSVGYGGTEFFSRAWASVKLAVRTRSVRSLHMDLPIAAGVGVGFADSSWATLTGTGDVWFDSITVLIAALLTARWLQLRSRRLAGDATDRLLSLIPSMVRRVTDDGATETVRIDDVFVNDVVRVPAGEVVPVDGLVATGTSTVNNAVLTGESRPESIAAGDAVTAGATNLSAPIDVLVQAAGTETRVGQLLAWVRDASGSDARVVSLADRLTGYFVAAVAVVALITAVVWWMIDPSQMAVHVVALLVITCPCALGMATPLAMAVAAGNAARAGIFIKNDAAIQQLTAVDAVVLDKTGTLTEGQLSLVETEGDDDAIAYAAALEASSTHPIAEALVRDRGTCGVDGSVPFDVSDVDTVQGQGIVGLVDGHRVAVGRPDWVQREHTALCGDASGDEPFATFAQDGHTPVAIAVNGELRAALAFGDRIRPSSRGIIERLDAQGTEIYLCSGDHPDTVHAVARRLGIPAERARGHVSPEDKQAHVEQLRAEGHTVMMIGDGVNDAAALRTADVGVAVEGGSTASLVAADIFMTRDGLDPVADMFDGADNVMRVIRRNLTFSLGYNILGAMAAIAGLVGPLVAAIAMPISSLIVVAASVFQRSFQVDAAPPPAAWTPTDSASNRPSHPSSRVERPDRPAVPTASPTT
jgi:P-type Cu2+ transporter